MLNTNANCNWPLETETVYTDKILTFDWKLSSDYVEVLNGDEWQIILQDTYVANADDICANLP